jgi:hypothetical protein
VLHTSHRGDGDRAAVEEISNGQRNELVQSGDDDETVRVRVYDESMLKLEPQPNRIAAKVPLLMLAKAVREDVMFMWFAAGNQKPDFRTLNDFRGKLLKGVMEEIFITAVKMLAAKGYIKLENYFVDGTKIESASGRYTFVWKKSVEKNDKKLDEKLRAYIKTAEQVWKEENEEYGDRDLKEMVGKEKFTSADVKELAGILREKIQRLESDEDKKKLKSEIKTIEKEYLPRKKRYEKAKRACGKRNSYSNFGSIKKDCPKCYFLDSPLLILKTAAFLVLSACGIIYLHGCAVRLFSGFVVNFFSLVFVVKISSLKKVRGYYLYDNNPYRSFVFLNLFSILRSVNLNRPFLCLGAFLNLQVQYTVLERRIYRR